MNSNDDNEGNLEAALIAAFDAYMKATKGREMNDKEIALVLRTNSAVIFDLSN